MSAGEHTKHNRKRESGAQLLARLRNHVDLSSIDPGIFDKPSATSASSTGSSSGKIIEIYGPEGTGKTEMVLHYIAKVCLPSQWNGHAVEGLGAKVVFVDTEFKFSVLRFAIIVEKQITLACEKREKICAENEHIIPDSSTFSSSSGLNREGVSDSVDATREDLHLSSENFNEDLCQRNINPQSEDSGSCRFLSSDGEAYASTGCSENSLKPLFERYDYRGGREFVPPQMGKVPALTAPDLEDLVQDTLSRLQVVRVQSTEQLLISLLSLENSLSCDPAISLIAIDTISAFFWTDRLGELENPLCTESKMSPIAGVILKLASEYGVTFLVTKSALIGSKRLREARREDFKSRYSSSSAGVQIPSEMMARKEKALQEHVEFLGRSWCALKAKRIVLTRNVDSAGKSERAAWCIDWPACRAFSCVDDGVCFL